MNTPLLKRQSAVLVTLLLMAGCGPSPTTPSTGTNVDERLTSLEKAVAQLTDKVNATPTPVPTPTPTPTPTVTEFSLQPTTVQVAVGAEVSFEQAVLTMSNGQTTISKDFSGIGFTSLDTGVATVDAGGKVKGIKEGATVITAKLGSLTKTVAVIVGATATPSATPTPTPTPTPEPTATPASSGIKSVSVDPESYEIKIGSSAFISTILVELDSGETGILNSRTNVTFTSNNTAIATVDASGVILAKAAGNTTVTVTYNGVSKDVPVTVTDSTS